MTSCTASPTGLMAWIARAFFPLSKIAVAARPSAKVVVLVRLTPSAPKGGSPGRRD
jgi:hypothetical protein